MYGSGQKEARQTAEWRTGLADDVPVQQGAIASEIDEMARLVTDIFDMAIGLRDRIAPILSVRETGSGVPGNPTQVTPLAGTLQDYNHRLRNTLNLLRQMHDAVEL